VNNADISKHMTRSWGLQNAVEAPVRGRMVEGAGWKEYRSSVQILATCGEAMAAHEISQHICSFIIMAWHEAAELIAAEGT
jgi:hypothetical protein